MFDKLKAKKFLIRQFEAEIANRRQPLELFAEGWRSYEALGSSASIDITDREIQKLTTEIAEFERCIAALGRQLDKTRCDTPKLKPPS